MPWRRASAGSVSGLGLAELLAPGNLARFLGMEERTELIRVYGVREIATGRRDPVAGRSRRPGCGAASEATCSTSATLASGLKRSNPSGRTSAWRSTAVAGVLALDLLCAGALGAGSEHDRRLPRRIRDYSARRGMPRPPDAMRGAARDFPVPRDMRIPELMRPYPS